ncbi:GLPGLI family protein [Pedobacter sp. UC225_65]|uniref:GLPGLI family protein n=1 Tax=Pedobacter sp. UC225_65 TaxID=3350173 RepID=UPI00366FA06E
MKIILAILFTASITSTVLAQNTDQALARVHYKFSHITDTTNRDEPFQENMILIIGKNASLYTSYDKMTQTDRLAAFLKEQTKANGGTLTNVVMQKGLIKKVTTTDFYSYANEQKSYTIEYMMTNTYIIPGELTPIKWTIKQDTMSFAGISCRKAITRYKGRNWIAWYAVDLPFQSGPWQLNGLPGLIIAAYDEKKDIQFQFDGLEKVNETNLVTKDEKIRIGTGELNFSNNTYLGKEIKLPTNVIKATRAEVNKLRQAIAENPMAAMSGGQISAGATVIRKNSTIQTKAKTTFNNPIELPEIKNN